MNREKKTSIEIISGFYSDAVLAREDRRLANWKRSIKGKSLLYSDEAVRGMKELGEFIGEKGINSPSCCRKMTNRMADRLLRSAPFTKFFMIGQTEQ